MLNEHLNRRSFNKLTAAAFGGVVAGVTAGVRGADEKKDDDAKGPDLLLKEPHVCRGLNACKGKEAKEAGADNACAGQGQCATAKHHSCKGKNECKGQGGCGEHPGQNDCKTRGDCAVPLEDDAWKTARKAFEKQMKKAKKEFGEAPPKKKV